MDLKSNRKNVLEYLKEFRKIIPTKNSLFFQNANVDISRLENVKDKIELFFIRGTLISPMSIDKSSIKKYMEVFNLIKQFPNNFKPDTLMESKIFEQTVNAKNTRRILLSSVMENNSYLADIYDKMIAYYLLLGGDKPVERFSKVEISMKQYGVNPDIRCIYNEIWKRNNNKIRRISYIKAKISKRMGIFQKSSIT